MEAVKKCQRHFVLKLRGCWAQDPAGVEKPEFGTSDTMQTPEKNIKIFIANKTHTHFLKTVNKKMRKNLFLISEHSIL